MPRQQDRLESNAIELQVFCGEQCGDTQKPKVLKSKVWQELVPQLSVKNRQPCCGDTVLRTVQGHCKVSDKVPDNSAIS
jgi:hypothetical protein